MMNNFTTQKGICCNGGGMRNCGVINYDEQTKFLAAVAPMKSKPKIGHVAKLMATKINCIRGLKIKRRCNLLI